MKSLTKIAAVAVVALMVSGAVSTGLVLAGAPVGVASLVGTVGYLFLLGKNVVE